MKMSKYRDFFGLYFPVFVQNTAKYGLFHAVVVAIRTNLRGFRQCFNVGDRFVNNNVKGKNDPR